MNIGSRRSTRTNDRIGRRAIGRSVRRALARWALGLTVVAAAIGFAAGSAGAATPASFAGESFFSGADVFGNPNEVVAAKCHPDGSTTLEFSLSGTAAGPYTGPFSENGTVTFGPQQLPNPTGRPFAVGPVTQFDASFTVTAPNGTVTGSKHLTDTGGSSSGAYGGCASFTDQQFEQYAHATGNAIELEGIIAAYSATIHTVDGSFKDTGRSSVSGLSASFQTADGGGHGISGFGEFFFGSTGVLPSGPALVTLTPPAATNPVGTSHTVTATAQDESGAPVAGVTIVFHVTGSDQVSGSCTTDINGQCSFTYSGPDLPGADQITGCADSDGNGGADPSEPCGIATKAWVLPAATPGQVTGGGQILNATGTDKISFGFNAKSDQRGIKGECTLVDPSGATKIKCTNVTDIVQSGTHATLFGDGTVNGTPTTYRIDVDDNAEPGSGMDTFKMHTSSGYTAGGTLVGGNIQIHG
jgi:hypothetical protein